MSDDGDALSAATSARAAGPAPTQSPADRASRGTDPLLVVDGLRKHYPIHGGVWGGTVGTVKAVDGVSLTVRRGETLGLVGESGCGKSTLGRTIIRLEEPTEGTVRFKGRELATVSKPELLAVRRDMQMVFQDPYSSLNPRMTVGEIVREPLLVHRMGSKEEQVRRVEDALGTVGLSTDTMRRYPHEFSGGQRQRVGLARALALDPELVIADEPVSALDVSVQSQVLNLMVRLQRERGLAYLFISHDLSVVRHVSDDVAIMYLGRIVERGPAERVFKRPAHPYTRALVAAIPVPDPTRRHETAPLAGETPSPVSPPSGCPFHPRCPHAIDRCAVEVPVLEPLPPAVATEAHLVSCIRKDEI